jgi:hypothetical protein
MIIEHQELVIGVRAAASILGVSTSYIGHLIKADILPIHENLRSRTLVKGGGRYVFLRDDLERILQTRDPETGKFSHTGSSDTRTMKLRQAQDLLGLPYDELFYLMDAGILKVVAHGVTRTDKEHPDYYIDTQSVLDLKTKRDGTTDEELLRRPLLDIRETCRVLQLSQFVVERLIDEKKLQCLNIMPKASYKVWRVTSSSVKTYISEQEKVVVTLEKAAEILGVTKQRVGQLVQKGKLEAKNIACDEGVVRWEISRVSIEAWQASKR